MSEIKIIKQNHLITGDVPLHDYMTGMQRAILPRHLRSIVSLTIILLSPVFLLSNYRPLDNNCAALRLAGESEAH